MQKIIRSQYLAALAMLENAITKCPDVFWNNAADKNKFWHIAFHAIFYTHLYIQPSESDFVPWAKYRENYESMEPTREPYNKADLIAYAAFCRKEIEAKTAVLDFTSSDSGFYWFPFGKLELQFYSIRHLQHHTGELCDRLGAAGIDVEWVGMQDV